MADLRKCSTCGSSIPADTPKGHCPVCLLRNALWIEALTEKEVSSVDPTETSNARVESVNPSVRRFGDYELLEEIGRGGMGVVYRARQVSLDRVVALKMLMFGSLATPQAIKRFRAEAATAASLQHPNIVAIHEVGVHADQHYLVMDFIQGKTLDQVIGNKPLPAKAAAAYLKVVAEAIHHAHQCSVLHRDLKPSNVLIDSSNQPHITDFGLAKRFGNGSESSLGSLDLTATGQVLGSPNYMAPEQAIANHAKTSRATDVYALGAILYQLVTGRPPFSSNALADTLHQVLHTEPVSPRVLNASVPRDLETICLKCLEKEPAKRYPTAQALAQELERFLCDEPILARPVSQFERVHRWCRRRPAVAVLAGATTLLLLAVLIGSPIAVHNIAVSRLLAEERLYVADMNLVKESWEEGDLQRARALLRAHVPDAGRPDLRGFEWRYLSQLCRDESRTVLPNLSTGAGGLAFSPDGGMLAVTDDKGLKLLEYGSTRQLFELPDPKVPAVAFLRGRRRLLATAGGRDHIIKLWDLDKRTVATEFEAGPRGAFRLAPSPDAHWLAVSDGDKGLGVWDLDRATNVWMRNTGVQVGAVLFSQDGKVLFSGGGDAGNPLAWDPVTGEILARFPPVHTGWVNGLSLSPDGRLLASCGNDAKIVLWNLEKRQKLAVLAGHEGSVNGVAFSPDGKLIASTSADTTVRLWDTESGRELKRLRGHRAESWDVVFAPDGKSILSSGADGAVRIWDVSMRQASNVLPGRQQWLDAISWSPDGQRLAAMEVHTGIVRLWDVRTRQVITNLVGHTDFGVFTAFSPDGQVLASGSYDRTVRLWDTKTFGLIGILTNRFEGGALAFSPDNRILAVAGPTLNPIQTTNRLSFWDLASHQELNLLPDAAPLASAISFAGNGRWLATGHFDGHVRLWDFHAQRLVAAFQSSNKMILSVAFSKDSSLLASCGYDSNIQVFDVNSRRLYRRLETGAFEIWSVAFGPDRRTLVSGGHDGKLRFWSLATGDCALILRQLQGSVTSVGFTRDGNLLASANADGDIWLWPAAPLEDVR
jgi:WD40 repeat protein/tRNA A-37 threonylcarbamoyl transferase component Bud32